MFTRNGPGFKKSFGIRDGNHFPINLDDGTFNGIATCFIKNIASDAIGILRKNIATK
jgi:hypothetical protein